MADFNDAPIPTRVPPTGPQIAKSEKDSRFDIFRGLWLGVLLVSICFAFYALQEANLPIFSIMGTLAAAVHYTMCSPENRTAGKKYGIILIICLIFIRLQQGDFSYRVCYTHLAGAVDSHSYDYTASANVTEAPPTNRTTPIVNITSCRIVQINPSRVFGFNTSDKTIGTGDCIRLHDIMDISRKQVKALLEELRANGIEKKYIDAFNEFLNDLISWGWIECVYEIDFHSETTTLFWHILVSKLIFSYAIIMSTDGEENNNFTSLVINDGIPTAQSRFIFLF